VNWVIGASVFVGAGAVAYIAMVFIGRLVGEDDDWSEP